MKIRSQRVEFMSATPDALKLIERAGRTCYKSEDKITDDSAEKFARMLIRRGHDSVLEHSSVTFRVTTDRGISHESVRHRIGMSPSQESTRYVTYEGIEVIEVPFKFPEASNPVWDRAMRAAEKAYQELLDIGEPPQFARSVLPTCLKTEFVFTGNFRSWRHFIKQRSASGAHPQIQDITAMVVAWFNVFYPVIVEDLI